LNSGKRIKNLTSENTACSTPAREHNTNLIKNKKIDIPLYSAENFPQGSSQMRKDNKKIS
jgi:hypothetical protein